MIKNIELVVENASSFTDSIKACHSRFERLIFGNNKEKETTAFLQQIKMTAEKNYGNSEIPSSFVDKNRKSIIFLPVDLQGSPGLNPIEWADGTVEDTDEKKRLRSLFFAEKFDELLILNIQQLEEVLRWCDSIINQENFDMIKSLYYRSIFTYFENLELYKLTSHDDLVIYRYAASDYEEEILPEDRKQYGGWILNSNKTVLNQAEYKVVTHWFRRDEALDTYKGYLGKKHVRRSTIGQAKETHFLALDSAENAAIVLITKH